MSVVACPKCAEKVTLPPQAPPAAKVRCPLCGENYLLSEALAAAPPMLEIVELPEGFSSGAAGPAEDVDVSPESFLNAVDRATSLDEDAGEFKLEGEGGVATAEETEPRYDEWGPTRSTATTFEPESAVKREPLITRPRKKKKGTNPLVHLVGIVAGGALAFPIAFLILLWMPGSWRRDPLELGPTLGRYAPFLVPAEFRPNSTMPTGDEPAERVAEKPQANSGTSKNARTPSTQPPVAATVKKPAPVTSDFDEPSELFPDPLKNVDLPTIDPLLDPTPDRPTPEPEPDDRRRAPRDEPPEPEVKPEPVPEPVRADPLQAARQALAAADEAFNTAESSAEKKAAAMGLYRAAAELAEKLSGDSDEEHSLEVLARDQMKLQVLGIAASSWLDNQERSSSGVVLSGVVKDCQPAGERFEVRIELPTRDKREVLVIAPQEFEAGQRLLVAGRIVEEYGEQAVKAVDARVVKIVQ